ncbi:hypothetical protein MA16_Dca028198 [Dendrobium catenatum]|uniref:Uncharacterized protein n=1 Tax=Dendrobium catenatum TaxID=906689 RepID=A0A2I0VAH5_9ASPA|nr:hypothetical protein MA16_Dca028198 [Dendrobium catenatum]
MEEVELPSQAHQVLQGHSLLSIMAPDAAQLQRYLAGSFAYSEDASEAASQICFRFQSRGQKEVFLWGALLF